MGGSLVIAISGGLTILFASLALASYLRDRKTNNARIGRALFGQEDVARENSDASQPTIKSHVLMFLGALGEASKPQTEEELSRVRRTLIQAGYRGADAPIILYGAKLCLMIVLPVAFMFLRTSALPPISSARTLCLVVVLAVTGFYLPTIWVARTMRRRKRKILEGFPDALDLMVVCVEAGLGLDAAISWVGKEIQLTHKVLSEEFKLLDLELRVGLARQKALRNLSLRTDLEEITSLVALLIQTDRFGTSVAQALRVHSEAMRTKRHQRAEEMAAKLPVKLLFPLVFFIFPSLFIVILGPGVIQIMRILLPSLAGK